MLNTLMKMNSKYVLTFFMVIGLLFGLNQISFGQCNVKFKYSVENASVGQSNGSVTIVFESSINALNFSIFDFSSGIPELITDATQKKDVTGRKVTFSNLPSATYIVRVGQKGCKAVIIEEKKGIVIGVKNGK